MNKKNIVALAAVVAVGFAAFYAVGNGTVQFGKNEPLDVNAVISESVDEAAQRVAAQYAQEIVRQEAELETLRAQVDDLVASSEVSVSKAETAKPEGASPQIITSQQEPLAVAPVNAQVQSASQQQESNEPPDGAIFTFEAEYAGSGERSRSDDTVSENHNTPQEVGDDFNYTLKEFAEEVFYYTNVIREEHGLPAFKSDSTLSTMAQQRMDEEGGKMSHQRPDGSTPDTIFSEYETTLICTGENIAGAGGSPESVARGFLETSHRDNVLNPNAEYMGIGVCWTDIVIGKRISTLQLFAK